MATKIFLSVVNGKRIDYSPILLSGYENFASVYPDRADFVMVKVE